jgi:acyl-CoA synthetase (AMP-forming)/AMP-acid ligase II
MACTPCVIPFSLSCLSSTISSYIITDPGMSSIALLSRLADLPPAGRRRLSHVIQFNTGAAPLAPEVIRKLKEAFPKIALRQAWGMSETCSCLTITPSGLQTWENAWTAGKPVAGASLKIVRPGTADEEVDAGQSGEVGTYGWRGVILILSTTPHPCPPRLAKTHVKPDVTYLLDPCQGPPSGHGILQ